MASDIMLIKILHPSVYLTRLPPLLKEYNVIERTTKRRLQTVTTNEPVPGRICPIDGKRQENNPPVKHEK
jgi:hypothetical protein